MITREQILKAVEKLPNAYYDMPWEGDFFSTVLRREGGKWFGIIIKASENHFKRYGVEPKSNVVLNLKCPPDLQVFLREKYPKDVLPAYHMNKTHWISVVTEGNVPKEEILNLLEIAYDLTATGKKK